ncbi:meiotic recombination protein SPO11 [Maniola jurtina]|uniref:meiotic recombination protein SPO11 n=1 Tax=Maniola jurtina TaxID=191418 RepID=UPI001E68B2A7|nr:meiotic recombination protein SPO11 [Maniola jurtina]
MELMNKDALRLRIDLASSSIFSFKQDPTLVAAINRLYSREEMAGLQIILPERKLLFTEVQQLLKQSCEVNVPTKPDDLTKHAKQTRNAIIKKIEDILGNINNSAERDASPKLIIRNQRLWSNCIYDLDRVALKSLHDAKTTTLCYMNAEDKSRFNTIVFVLTKVHELLSKNLTVTRRELFYQNVSRFGNQSRVDVGVRDVCCLLDIPPWDLGIVATAKGLIAGPLKIYQSDGSIVDCMMSGGTLIPQDIKGIKEFKSSAKYILVVEKDAIFQKLLDEGALIRLGPVIILTGKGYPDVCTRQLLCRLVNELRLKALALVDPDPHGYEIFLTYKYGSLAQSHLSDSLACSSLLLLGARHHDIMILAPKAAQLPLTQLDKRKLAALIKRPYLNTPTGARVKSDLEVMLMSGVKAEIEAVASTAAALCDSYLPSKLIQGDHLG